MELLQSPFENGDIKFYPKSKNMLSLIIVFLGSLVTYNYSNIYLNSLKKQILARGPIKKDIWGDKKRQETAKKIEGIVNEICWGEDFTFHPDDPYIVVGEFECGDLSEIEAVMEIEHDFSISLLENDQFEIFLKSKPTFGQFVDLVISKCS